MSNIPQVLMSSSTSSTTAMAAQLQEKVNEAEQKVNEAEQKVNEAEQKVNLAKQQLKEARKEEQFARKALTNWALSKLGIQQPDSDLQEEQSTMGIADVPQNQSTMSSLTDDNSIAAAAHD
jgi:chromosome segregation ATPase